MKKTATKILQTVIIPYVLLVILLYISFWMTEGIVNEVIGRIFGYASGIRGMWMEIIKSVATISLSLILGVGAIKFIDRYNQEKEQP